MFLNIGLILTLKRLNFNILLLKQDKQRRFPMTNQERTTKKERNIAGLLFGIASLAVTGVILIIFFVLKEGWPVLLKYGPFALFTGKVWQPMGANYGMAPLIVGSTYVALVALVIGVPFGVGCAVFMAEIAPEKVSKVVRPAINLLAGIPSVVYGFFGMVVLVPLLRTIVGGLGFSVLAGGIILAIMILPTIISVSEDSIRAAPRDYKEASLALGATHWQTIYKVLAPAARSGIMAAVVLGMGRAIGETMAVIMITGNTPLIPKSLFEPGATLTGTIGMEWAYASGEHAEALFTVGIFLFGLIMIINSIALFFSGKKVET